MSSKHTMSVSGSCLRSHHPRKWSQHWPLCDAPAKTASAKASRVTAPWGMPMYGGRKW